ncbi:MAG: MerR family DNA-binding transcriptional regulator [Aridibacter sp.]
MDSKCLTTKEVARLCRVSDATVKRWEEAGLIKSERTSGGHRRFRAEEVARFQQKQQLGLKCEHGDESVITAQSRRRKNKELCDSELFHSLIAGREEEVANMLINEFLNGKLLTELFDNSISKAMRRIGELWFEGKVSIAQEHLATQAMFRAIHKLRCVIPICEPCQKLAICFAIEGDFHELPTYFSQMTFENAGWEVINFGANTPLYVIAEEVLHHSPNMLCMSSSVMMDIERTSRDYEDFREKIKSKDFPIVFGGHTFEDEKIRNRFSADFYAKTFTDVADIVKDYS